MTASPVTTLRVRTCSYQVVAATGEVFRTTEESIYATLSRPGRRWAWSISTGVIGEELASGRAWSRDGAVGAATRAAHRPGGWRGAR